MMLVKLRANLILQMFLELRIFIKTKIVTV
jgi:hypothetical protein